MNFQSPNELQRGIPEHMVLFIGQGLGRTDHNGIASVDAHGIQILHVADGDSGIIAVAHDLVFNFLKALNALLYKNLMDRGEG